MFDKSDADLLQASSTSSSGSSSFHAALVTLCNEVFTQYAQSDHLSFKSFLSLIATSNPELKIDVATISSTSSKPAALLGLVFSRLQHILRRFACVDMGVKVSPVFVL